MAKILRGKNRGKTVEINQFCNDWISCMDGKIHNPTSLEFTDEEKQRMLNTPIDDCGNMFKIYEFRGNRIFKRLGR